MSGDDRSRFAIEAWTIPARTRPSTYPEPFFSRMAKREKRALGDFCGLKNFGLNLTRLAPGGESSLIHQPSTQDEFVFVRGISGTGNRPPACEPH